MKKSLFANPKAKVGVGLQLLSRNLTIVRSKHFRLEKLEKGLGYLPSIKVGTSHY